MKYAFHGRAYDACWYAAWEGKGSSLDMWVEHDMSWKQDLRGIPGWLLSM